MKFAITSVLFSFFVVATATADIAGRGIPGEAEYELSKADETNGLTCVAFTPNGGWSLLYGTNGYSNRNIPEEAHRQIQRIANEGHELKCIAFTATGGWSLLYGTNGYFNRNIPEDAHQAMYGRHELKWIAFRRNGGWSLIFD